MRKFKLIQTYPHPVYKLEIGMIIEQQGSIYLNQDKKSKLNTATFGREIENYPQYWEEIIELPKIYSKLDMEQAYLIGHIDGCSDYDSSATFTGFNNWLEAYTFNKDS